MPKHGHPLIAFLLAAALAAAPAPAVFAQSPADAADVGALNRSLDDLARERLEAEQARPFGWEINGRAFDLGRGSSRDRSTSIVELFYDARELPCFVSFRPLEGGRPVEAPMGVVGSQWIRLEPGEYEVRLHAGFATGPVVEHAPAVLELRAGRVYRLTYGEREEDATRKIAREAQRAAQLDRRPQAQQPSNVVVETLP